MIEKEKGFVKEIIIVALAILALAYFNIDIQVVAAYIKMVFAWIINLFN